MSTANRSLFLYVTIRVSPSDVPAFLEAFRPCWEGVVSEPENIYFDVTQDPERPGLFRFVEVWTKDKEWFLSNQLNKPYYEPYLKITQPMWIEERKP